jgi:RNA polymerase sigma-70 factor (ECF subfamily)
MSKGSVVYQADQSRDSSTILQRIAQGEKNAVQECLNIYSRQIWDFARKFTNNREDAEDLVQEVFIDIWKNAARFDQTKSPEWLFVRMIARRRIIDFLRKSYRRPQSLPFDDALDGNEASNAHQKLQMSLDIKSVTDSLNKLKVEESKLIRLAIYSGLSHKEIARRVGLPVGTVKTHIRRGMKKMRFSLGLRRCDFSLS